MTLFSQSFAETFTDRPGAAIAGAQLLEVI